MNQGLGLARYRFRATIRRRWAGYLALVLLIGLVGGIAMAALAGARRTQSSFPAFLARTNGADLGVVTAVLNPDLGSKVGYNPTTVERIAQLPHVSHVVSYTGLNILPLAANGDSLNASIVGAGDGDGSVNGFYFTDDIATPIAGRMADPKRADEFETDEADAKLFHLHVGQVVPFGIYTNPQTNLPGFGTAKVQPYRRLEARLVGIVVPDSALVQDDVDATVTLTSGIFTPALTHSLLGCCTNYTITSMKVDDPADIPATELAVDRLLPKGFPPVDDTSSARAQAERAIEPEAIALAVFGGIAALAALLVAAQVIGRQLQVGTEQRNALRALGASPAMLMADGLIGLGGAVVIGALLAAAIAVSLSPLTPLGPVRRVDPHPPVAFDWTVLGFGLLVLVVGLVAVAVALAYRELPHRVARHPRGTSRRGSLLARLAGTAGMPASAVTGIGFALEPGGGRTSVPVRSAILGAGLAMVVVMTTLTFGTSLHTLVSRPRLYGWNWDYGLSAGDGAGDIPQQTATRLLDQDHDIAAWSGAYFGSLILDGQNVSVLGESPRATVSPPILSGHEVDAPDEVVLGPVTLAALHRHIGDTVEASNGTSPPTAVHIVGTATLPTIGEGGSGHLEMGTGAVVATDLIPPADRNQFNAPMTGPNEIFVRLNHTATRSKALAALNHIAEPLSNSANFGVTVGSVQHPAEIVNYRTMGTTPALLGAGLAAGAVGALGLTLLASVRRRRRDLALLKTLGFTRRQLAAAVAWQSTVAVAIGTVVGVPLGIALGRELWIRFAEKIHVVPTPSLSPESLVLVVVGGLVLANIVAAVPGRIATRTPITLVLRAE